jgi:hypothetical protein
MNCMFYIAKEIAFEAGILNVQINCCAILFKDLIFNNLYLNNILLKSILSDVKFQL